MSLVIKLIGFGVKQIVPGAAGETAVGTTEKAAAWLSNYLADPSLAIPKALAMANERAWKALALALAGDGLIDKLKVTIADGLHKGLRAQVGPFLASTAVEYGAQPADFRKACLAELKQARERGDLSADRLTPDEVARAAAAFERYAKPSELVEGSHRAVAALAWDLSPKYPNLSALLRRPTPAGPSLLVSVFTFFFEHECATKPGMAHVLMLSGLRELSAHQSAALTELGRALADVGDHFDELIGQVMDALSRIEGVVVQTQAAVLDVGAEVRRLSAAQAAGAGELHRLAEAVLAMQGRVGMGGGEVKPRYSFSIRTDDERRAVEALLARFRQLPPEQQHQAPALLNGLGKLQVGAGDFEGAGRTFAEVARTAAHPAARAEAQFNAYRAALEQERWEDALAAVREAAELDPARFTPFPMQRYQPKHILGAGGFGAAFLCHDVNFGTDVVVKSLHAADLHLERGVQEVFAEARVLRSLRHPAIIEVLDCNYAHDDPATGKPAQPYLVMDYFPGFSLEAWLKANGPLTVPDLLEVARQVAAGMKAAHARSVLHRDLKPDNLLVRREPPAPGSGPSGRWDVRIIDFGLALRRDQLSGAAAGTPSSTRHSILDSSTAGTMKYAPPEQRGELPGVPPGTYSDVYSFGKTCCQALFRTAEPKDRHWRGAPPALRELLDECTDEELEHRCRSFEQVLARLESIAAGNGAGAAASRGPTFPAAPKPPPVPPAPPKLPPIPPVVPKVQPMTPAVPKLIPKPPVPPTLPEWFKPHPKQDRPEREGPRQDGAENVAAPKDTSRKEEAPSDPQPNLVVKEPPRLLKAGELLTNSLGMKLAYAPPGAFLMGSPKTERGRLDNESQHRVMLTRGFYMATTPVTQGQWKAVMGTGVADLRDKVDPDRPLCGEGDDHPIYFVSWDDAAAFCDRLSQVEGQGWRYRLPTEAEWEYACRAGTTGPYGGTGVLDEMGWFADNSGDAPLDSAAIWQAERSKYGQRLLVNHCRTHPVGRKKPNAWGLYDMHGNVWEWCSDAFAAYTIASSRPEGGPTGWDKFLNYLSPGPAGDAVDPTGPKVSLNVNAFRVTRGGSWSELAPTCRSACRSRDPASDRHNYLGFRVCLEVT